MNIFKTLVLSAGLVLAAASAHAMSWTEDGSTSCETTSITPPYDECFGFVEGNLQGVNGPDVNNDTFGGLTGIFGHSDWQLIQSDGSFPGDTQSSFEIAANDFGEVIVGLKGSNEWAFFRYLSGLEGTISFALGNGAALSNYLVYGRTPEIPVPAAGFLLLGGLGALGLMRRRKQASA